MTVTNLIPLKSRILLEHFIAKRWTILVLIFTN